MRGGAGGVAMLGGHEPNAALNCTHSKRFATLPPACAEAKPLECVRLSAAFHVELALIIDDSRIRFTATMIL